MARLWLDAVNRRGGDVTVVHLPEMGIRGNTHFPFSDLNNAEVAELMSKFLRDKGLDECRRVGKKISRPGNHPGTCSYTYFSWSAAGLRQFARTFRERYVEPAAFADGAGVIEMRPASYEGQRFGIW